MLGLSVCCIALPLISIKNKYEKSKVLLKGITFDIDVNHYEECSEPKETVEEFQQYYDDIVEYYHASTTIDTKEVQEFIGTNSKLRSAAMYIAQHFVLPDGQQCWSNHKNHPHNSIYGYSNHNGVTMYSTVIPMRDNYARIRHDCSGFVSALAYYSGMLAVPVQPSSYYWYKQAVTGFQIVPATTYADVHVGDIFACDGHVAIVVDDDGERVYFGDCGSCRRIEQTATRGFSYTHEYYEPVSNWNKKPSVVLRSIGGMDLEDEMGSH